MKKRKKQVLFLAVAAVLVISAVIYNISSSGDKEITQFERPGYGQEKEVHEVEAVIGESRYSIEVEIPAREIPDNELQQAFDKAYEYVLQNLKGDNESLDNITGNMNFVQDVSEYGMSVEYYTSDYKLVNCFGEVNTTEAVKSGSPVRVQIEITYGDISQMYETDVMVYPAEESVSDMISNDVSADIAGQDKGSQSIKLPETVGGSRIKFYEPKTGSGPLIIFAAILIGAVIYYIKKIRPAQFDKARENQMDMDYSEIVAQLSLLIGAGMSGAGAFARIAADYTEARRQNKKDIRYAYEEMVTASNRIAMGVSESDAYAAFGRACRTHAYIKLGNLMSQNVRKGGEYFMQMLREEVGEAFAQRKALARKRGEEAGTKLLLPMIMMLGIVLIIIVVPAFMSF